MSPGSDLYNSTAGSDSKVMAARPLKSYCLGAALVAALACGVPGCQSVRGPRTITVQQSGAADVIGADNVALQRAADMLRPGDTLLIGPGTYTMHNSLLLPSSVTVRGMAGQTILWKDRGVQSLLAEDGDYGETRLRVVDPTRFHPGMGITLLDDATPEGYGVHVAAITAVDGDVLRIHPMTLHDYNVERRRARVQNTFPILCAMNAEKITIEDIVVDGNKSENAYLDGCRGGAIYLYQVRDATVRNCVARNYNGDGISFQISENTRILNCESYGHTGFGVHPGTGTHHAIVRDSRIHDNGDVGIYLCYRVRHSEFANNIIERNGRYGISIGHKDTDNVFVGNAVSRNGHSGIYLREQTLLNSGHRNTFRRNAVTDNGGPKEGYGFYIAPHARGTVIEENRIEQPAKSGRHYAVYAEEADPELVLQDNTVIGEVAAAKGGSLQTKTAGLSRPQR